MYKYTFITYSGLYSGNPTINWIFIGLLIIALLWRRLSAKELMLLNCGVGEDSWESLGLQGDPTSPFWRRSALGFLWKERYWSWNSSTLATSCEELTHWKRLWCWKGLGARGEGDDRGWDGWMPSLTLWTWVWVNSGSWWWTWRPGMLWFRVLQRVGQDWVTDLICWRRLLRVPWTARRSKQSILKEISLACSLERLLKLKLQYFGQLMWRPDSFEKTLMLGKIEGRRRRGRERIRWLHGITDSMDICLGGLQELVIDREAWPAAVHVITKILTQLSDWTWLNWWDWIPWPLFFECWVLSQLFHSLLSLLAEGYLVPLCFLP